MEKTSKLTLSQIGQINLNVKNVQEAVSFYNNILGLPLLFAMEKWLSLIVMV